MAGLAEPDQLQQVVLDIVPGVATHLVEEQSEIAALDLDCRPASATDQVVMVTVVGGCVSVTAIVCVDAPYETEI